MIYATPRAPQTHKQNQQIIFLANADSCNFSLLPTAGLWKSCNIYNIHSSKVESNFKMHSPYRHNNSQLKATPNVSGCTQTPPKTPKPNQLNSIRLGKTTSQVQVSASASASAGYKDTRIPQSPVWVPVSLPELSCQSYSNWSACRGIPETQLPTTRISHHKLTFTHKQLKFWPDFRLRLNLSSTKFTPFLWQNQQVNCTAACHSNGDCEFIPLGAIWHSVFGFSLSNWLVSGVWNLI